MSIQSEIDRLNAAKADIQSALVEGGQTVESTDTLTDYAGKIRALSSGFAEQIAYHNEDSEAHSDIRAAIPTETSQLTNDSGYIDTTEAIDLISSHGSSVNGYANLTVEAGDNIGLTFKNGEPDAYGSSTEGTMTISATVPTKTSDLTNDSGFITGYTETDPTVPAWAKSASKPTYTYSEVGAAASSHTHTPASIGAAPAYTYGTADLTAGVSALATGQLHFVYEVGDDNSDAN